MWSQRITSAMKLTAATDAKAIGLLLLIGLCAALPLSPAHAAGAVLLGQQTLAPVVDSNTAGTAEAFRTTASANGTVVSLSVYVDASSTATNLVVGLYTDKPGTPGSLLAKGTLASPAKGTWNTVLVPNTAVVANTVYWIAVLSPSGSGKLAFRASGSNGSRSETSKLKSLGTLPATWTTGKVFASSPLSAYGSAEAATQPVLSVAPSTLLFNAVEGGSDPAPGALTVSNTGIGTLNFTASSDAAWLSVAPTSGAEAPTTTLQVSASLGGRSAGSYTGNVTVVATGAQNSPALVPVTLTVTAPPPPGTSSNWLTYGHDPQRSGNAAGESTISSSNVGNLALAWSAAVDGKITAQPLFVSSVQVGSQTRDVVVVATNQNTVYALDASTGAQLWRNNLVSNHTSQGTIPGGFGISAAPVVDRVRGLIFTVTEDGVLRVLSLSSGTQVNSLAAISGASTNLVWGALNLVGNSLYIPTASNGADLVPWWGRIVRVDVSATPTVVGTFKVVPGVSGTNAGGGIWGYGGVSVDPSNGHVYAATSADAPDTTGGTAGYEPYAGRLVALASDLGYAQNNSVGAPLGSYEPPHPSPCQGEAGACDMDFGATPLIFQPTGCPTLASAGNKNGYLYVIPADDLAASDTTRLQAVQLNIAYDSTGAGGVTGVPAYWPEGNTLFVTFGSPVSAGPPPDFSQIFANVVALKVGPAPACAVQVAWSIRPFASYHNQPPSTPTIANDVVFVGSGVDGGVRAFNAATGAQLWSSGSLAGPTFAAPSVAGGSLYVGSWDNTARAFRLSSSPPPPPSGNVLLGDEQVEVGIDQNSLGSAEAFETTAIATGTVSTLSVYIDSSSTAGRLVAGLYSDSAGHPGTLIAQGSVTPVTAGAWNEVSISQGAMVTAGNPYWIAILGTTSGTIRFRDRVGGNCNSETSAQSNLTSLPASWATGTTYTTCPVSAYGSKSN